MTEAPTLHREGLVIDYTTGRAPWRAEPPTQDGIPSLRQREDSARSGTSRAPRRSCHPSSQLGVSSLRNNSARAPRWSMPTAKRAAPRYIAKFARTRPSPGCSSHPPWTCPTLTNPGISRFSPATLVAATRVAGRLLAWHVARTAPGPARPRARGPVPRVRCRAVGTWPRLPLLGPPWLTTLRAPLRILPLRSWPTSTASGAACTTSSALAWPCSPSATTSYVLRAPWASPGPSSRLRWGSRGRPSCDPVRRAISWPW